MNILRKVINNPYKILAFFVMNIRLLNRILSDDMYLKIKYRSVFGKKLDLESPKTFNEKLQWLKLYDRRPEYTIMVDKYEAKKYVADKIGEEYIIPTLGVWTHFDDIDFDTLPNQFVLKCTHDSGGIVICRDKGKFDKKSAKKKIETCLKKNFFYVAREWPYKNVKPRIIAEKYMVDKPGCKLMDYKIFGCDCFAKAMSIATNKQIGEEDTKFDFYNSDFKYIPFTNGHPNADHGIKYPESFNKMKEIAENFSKKTSQFRIEFYNIKGKIYFGELTLLHWRDMLSFEPEEDDYKLGEWIKLSETIGGGYLIANKGWILYVHEGNSQQVVSADTLTEKKELLDYKLMCFNGKVQCSFVCSDRFNGGLKVTFYDDNWNVLPFERHYPRSDKPIAKPQTYNQMVQLAEQLSENIPFVRVDFYEIDGKPYFGEMTFYPGSGFEEFIPESADYELGELIKLPEIVEGD